MTFLPSDTRTVDRQTAHATDGSRPTHHPAARTPLECPGNTCAPGSRSTARLVTAVAASPEPVALSLTSPVQVQPSPAA